MTAAAVLTSAPSCWLEAVGKGSLRNISADLDICYMTVDLVLFRDLQADGFQ